MKYDKQKLIKAVGTIIMLCSFIFIIKAFLSFNMDFSVLLSPKYISAICLCLIANIAGFFLIAYCWKLICMFFSGKNVSFFSVLPMYTKSNLGKYLPGNVGHYAGRQLFGTSLGMSQTQLLLSSVFEIIYISVSALLLSLALVRSQLFQIAKTIFPNINLTLLLGAIAVSGVFILAVVLFVFRKNNYLKELLALIKTKAFWLLLIKTVIIGSANFIIVSLSFALMLGIKANVTVGNSLAIIAAFITSWFIGYVTPGIPGGIGVREMVLTLMLSLFYPQEIVLTAAVLQRFTAILCDILMWPLSMALNKRHAKK